MKQIWKYDIIVFRCNLKEIQYCVLENYIKFKQKTPSKYPVEFDFSNSIE